MPNNDRYYHIVSKYLVINSFMLNINIVFKQFNFDFNELLANTALELDIYEYLHSLNVDKNSDDND